MKQLVAIAALAVCTLGVASAKTYDVYLSNQTKAGAIQLKPGDYKLKVEGSNAVFTDTNSLKSYTTPAKIETTERKFDQTRVETTKQGNSDVLQEIDLGGSKTKLEF
jgi:hypothetical protein